ncbi:MAG: chemotaxis response regulator protein-glutamate methylesterase [Planctomycetia bacterium]|nr:chemotaxis response regulator protein-glutamate methylesterase [Planctomycetia bacterium]
MRKIRVLVVDDSVVIRRLLTDVLGQDPEIELAGTAPNGRIALAKLPQLCPDLVTLDIEMPELDGLGTLPELRKLYPRLPVIMFSTLTERGAVATLDALALGATDYVTKPANVGSVAAAIQSVRDQLIPKIKALCATAAVPKVARTAPFGSPPGLLPPTNRLPQRCDAVVIGSSTGGPQALMAVLGKLPASFPVPIVVVQHMPPLFTHHLANRLNQECALTVREAANHEPLQAGEVLIAPGNFHVELRRGVRDVTVLLNQTPPENSCRPAVDVLFRSAAAMFGAHCAAVVLTGMGQDGRRGAEQIVRAGGLVIAQDEATSVVWGMPRAVAEAGLARHVLPLAAISQELLRNVAVGRRTPITLGAHS